MCPKSALEGKADKSVFAPTKHLFAVQGTEIGSGDYPHARLFGQTQHFKIYADRSLGSNADAICGVVMQNCERDLNTVQSEFGGISLPNPQFNVVVAVGVGGAYHYGCNGVDIYCDGDPAPQPDGALTSFVLVAELVEVFEAAQGAGWDCGASNGEGLSRVLATDLYPDELTRRGFASAPAWLDSDRADYVTVTLPSDTTPVANGCAVLFLNYLRYQLGYNWAAIVAAAGPTLAASYRQLTGKSDDPFPAFLQLVSSRFPKGTPSGLDSDNPFPIQAAVGLLDQRSSHGSPVAGPMSASRAMSLV